MREGGSPTEPHVPHDLSYPHQCCFAQETMLSMTHSHVISHVNYVLLVNTFKHAIYYPLAKVLRLESKINFTGHSEVQLTGLL